MLNGLAGGYAAMRALSVVSILATIDPTGQTHAVAYADPDANTTEQSGRKAETVCVLAETVRRHIVTFQTSCKSH